MLLRPAASWPAPASTARTISTAVRRAPSHLPPPPALHSLLACPGLSALNCAHISTAVKDGLAIPLINAACGTAAAPAGAGGKAAGVPKRSPALALLRWGDAWCCWHSAAGAQTRIGALFLVPPLGGS